MPKRTRSIPLTPALERLGLTPLEAEVYAYLIQAEPATGYRIAQALGKPVGMIYKAVEALEGKGAALSADDGESRVIRAAPLADFIGQTRKSMDDACAAAQSALAMTPDPVPDDRFYRLTTREQAVQRAIAMLGESQRFALVNATPAIAGDLAQAMTLAVERGVRIGWKSFEPASLPGVDVRVDPRGAQAVHSAPGEWLTLSVDGRDVLAALFDHASGLLRTGYWTQHPLLAWVMFSGMSADFALADVRQALALGESSKEIQARFAKLAVYASPDTEGKLALMNAYRRPSPAPSRRHRNTPADDKK